MKKLLLVFCLVSCVIVGVGVGRAQTGANAQPYWVTVTGLHTSCPLSPVGTAAAPIATYCYAGDGPWFSVNGAAYTQMPTAPAAGGVTSVTVNGGTPQTGAVAIMVPTKAVIAGATAPLQ